MMSVFVAGKGGRSRFEHASGPLEFGREPRVGVARQVLGDPFVSADQVRVEELPDGRVRLENLSRRVHVALAGGAIEPGQSTVVELPVRMTIGETLIDLAATGTGARGAEGLSTLEPGEVGGLLDCPTIALEGSATASRLTLWFKTVLDIQRAAASRSDFYRDTARAVVDLVGLDSGLVLLRGADDWRIVARADRQGGPDLVGFSRTTLDRACRERRTFYQAATSGSTQRSLMGVEAVVVSPIFGADESVVVGALYGARLAIREGESTEIRELEAQLVQILAAAVGAGMARLGAEAEASRRLVQFEQFFSPELARELELDPGLLDGRDRPITVLFSDIRGFSAISERLTPRQVCRLVGDVMDRLTARIREHRGVVVDYVGDGLLAMWNAPAEQPDHARLACLASRAMVDELAGLNERWRPIVGAPLRLGIGLNTGDALVGNTGSSVRFKYGPLGHSVNLASRIEGATKQFGVPILMTGSTHSGLAGALPTRRLCRVRVVGIEDAVDLHELLSGPLEADWQSGCQAFESGLRLFEAGDLPGACRVLYPVLGRSDGGYDVPTLTLIGRAIDHLKAPDLPFDPILKLTSK